MQAGEWEAGQLTDTALAAHSLTTFSTAFGTAIPAALLTACPYPR